MKNLNIFSLVTEYENAKSGGVLNVPNVSFVDEDSSVRYLLKNVLTHNGYEYIDLGLPSGLKWATCNVGATSPEDYGLYFAWGETTGYTAEQITSGVRSFSSSVYKSGSAASISTDLTLEQDAAHVNLGGNWRMPTKVEFQELIDNCDVTLTDDYNGTGIKGRTFTSKINSKSVFFPFANSYYYSVANSVDSLGIYWSASMGEWNPSSYSSAMSFSHVEDPGLGNADRVCGNSVRGVCE